MLEKRIVKIEQEQEASYNRWQSSLIDALARKPHVCPVCEGRGQMENLVERHDCHSCSGKGVLWG